MTDAGAIINFSATDNSTCFKFKQKITGISAADGTKNVERILPLRKFKWFWDNSWNALN